MDNDNRKFFPVLLFFKKEEKESAEAFLKESNWRSCLTKPLG